MPFLPGAAARIARVLFAAFLIVPVYASANPSNNCLISMSAVPAPVRFQDYPAMSKVTMSSKAPVLDTAEKIEYRSVLRHAAAKGPNFAGHFTVAVWGCGSSCTDFAIIDARSGKVVFDQSLRAISGIYLSDEPGAVQPAYNALRFRRDSNLLVVLGAPREDEARDGVAFYEWTGSKLQELRFVPRASACKMYTIFAAPIRPPAS